MHEITDLCFCTLLFIIATYANAYMNLTISNCLLLNRAIWLNVVIVTDPILKSKVAFTLPSAQHLRL